MAKRKKTAPVSHPKLPNGFGRITEIKGRFLRNPFRAMVTIGRDEEGRPIGKIVGYYSSWYEAYDALSNYHKNPYDLTQNVLTIQDLYERWSKNYFEELKGEASIRTVTTAWLYVPLAFRKQNAADVRPQALKDSIQDAHRIEQGKSIPASDNIKSRLKSIYNLMYDYAVLGGLVDINPARQFSLKGIQGRIERQRKDKNPFTLEHEQDLWNDLDFGCTRMVLINIYSSWRPEEMLELQKANINLKEMTMIGGMKTQAGTNRLVPIHPKIQELIKYYYDLSPGPNLFYDYNSKGKAETLTYDKYRGRFKKIMDRHGWTDYSPSCPRHTFSTKAKEAHMEELARKRMMGHEITDVTDKHYTHLDLVKYLSAEIKKI